MKLPSDSTQGRHVVHTTQQLLPQASHRTFPRRQQKGEVCSARLPPKLQRRPAQRVCKSNTSKVQSSTPHTLLDGRAESTRTATLSRRGPTVLHVFHLHPSATSQTMANEPEPRTREELGGPTTTSGEARRPFRLSSLVGKY